MGSKKAQFPTHIAVFVVLLLPATALTGSLDLTWNSIDGGGGVSTAGAQELGGTIGQHDAGTMSGGSLELAGGFWSGIELGGPCGDFDLDGDIDLADFAILSVCFAGSSNPPALSCPVTVNADCDADGDVDLGDYSSFAEFMTGPE